MQITNAQITLTVDGVARTFSENELTDIVRKDLEAIKKRANIQRPMENIPFEIDLWGIDLNLFKEEREDPKQEETRLLILEAFDRVDKFPSQYREKFKTLMPVKTWEEKTIKSLKRYANSVNFGYWATWVEQALEWAQRIANGEPWRDICNIPDTADWCRLIKWKDGRPCRVGGSRKSIDNCDPASYLMLLYEHPEFPTNLYNTVPLIVLCK